ncbi:MAG TPA: response regulator [Gemmatimonadaceae bacterium]|nr:response regulator [Gemmatimonadaceae bacterium]
MTGPAPHAEPRTILLVDDEPSVRSIIVKILRRAKFTVLEAESGAEAHRIVEGHSGKIDMVITDLFMPGQQGPEVVEALSALRPGLKVLFISGYADHDLVARTGLDDGAHFLQKPFSGRQLLAAVGGVLEG